MRFLSLLLFLSATAHGQSANNFRVLNDLILPNQQASSACYIDSDNKVKSSTVSQAELEALIGVSTASTIQSQLDSKQASLGFTPENTANKGVALGYVPLDSNTKISPAYIYDSVDSVQEYANFAAFPGTGANGILYVALDTSKVYRWASTMYVEIVASPGSTDSVTEGSTNLYFTEARVRSTPLTGFTTGPNSSLTFSDTVLEAFEKVQGQLNAKFNAPTNTTPSSAHYLSGLNGGTWLGFGSNVIAQPLPGLSASNAAITSSDTILSAFGKAQGQIDAKFPISGGTLTGTGGAGFIGLPGQSTGASAPTSGVKLYSNNSGHLAVMPTSGFPATFSLAGLTVGRIYTLPNNTGTLALTNAITTTGTNASWSTSGVLNLPSASSTARGLLTNTDWTTFNSKFSGTGGDLTGTAAYIGLPAISAPTGPSTGVRLFSNASGQFSIVNSSGFAAIFDSSALTAGRSYSLPNGSGTFAFLASPAFSGTPTAPTATAGTNTTQIATTAFVQSALSGVTPADATISSKGIIQLAGDLGGTASAPTVPGLTSKAPINNPTFTGTVTLPGAPATSLEAATKGYVDTAVSGVSPVWGALTGTLSDQLDLQAALDGKANSSHVHAQSDITGLITALSGKSDVGHTHTSSNITDFSSAAKTAAVSDTAYASSWNGVTDTSPSKNSIFDKIEAVVSSIPTALSQLTNNMGFISGTVDEAPSPSTIPVRDGEGDLFAVGFKSPNTGERIVNLENQTLEASGMEILAWDDQGVRLPNENPDELVYLDSSGYLKSSGLTPGDITGINTTLGNHVADQGNPHGVTATQVGLGNVQNVDQTNPANITQSSSYRFVTDTEKATWDGKWNTPTGTANSSTYARGDGTFASFGPAVRNTVLSGFSTSSSAQVTSSNDIEFAIGKLQAQINLFSNGRSGGFTLVGGNASGENLTLQSTSNATRGKINFGSAATSAYDEVNDRFGIGTNAPSSKFEIVNNGIGVAPPADTHGIKLTNNTAATASITTQSTPPIYWRGHGWNPVTLTSTTADWRAYATGLTGTNPISSSLVFQSSIGGAAYANAMTLTAGGAASFGGSVSTANGFNATGTIGTSSLAGQLTVGNNSNFIVAATTNSTTNWAMASNLRYNVWSRFGTNVTPNANEAYANMIVGSNPLTIASSGTHPFFAALALQAPSITNGTGTLTNAATLYIHDAPTQGTNRYALMVNSGNTFLGGNFNSGTSSSSNNINGTTNIGNLNWYVTGSSSSTAVAGHLPTGYGLSSIIYNVAGRPAAATVLGANQSYSSYNFGSPNVTRAATGTHAMATTIMARGPTLSGGSTTAANSAGLFVDQGSGATNNWSLYLNTGDSYSAGKAVFDSTNTASGTTGAQTINKPSFTVNFAASDSSLVVTNSFVGADSIVLCTVMANDATAYIKNTVPSAGSVTINLGAAATAETRVGCVVHN